MVMKVSAAFFAALFLLGCSRSPAPALLDPRAEFCESIEGAEPEYTYDGASTSVRLDFAEIRDAYNSACMSCHQAPAGSGNFTYIDSISSELRTIGGVTRVYPGFQEIAEKSIEVLLTSDETRQMPPRERRQKNPENFLELGRRLQAWVDAGRPPGSFNRKSESAKQPPQQTKRTELGQCLPKAEIIGMDYKKDREFKAMMKLPSNLGETDIFTFDSLELGRRGTVAYNVAYPLWADNSDKGRWVHLPAVIENGRLVRQTIRFNSAKGFDIPENTRFYKTFYKRFENHEGHARYRRVETRIIVVRKPFESSLFGTYKWDDEEKTATLVEIPYRDGSGFKDHIFDINIDVNGKKRKYAIPGSQRCLDCHRGSEMQNFILGFTPLQLNHRPAGDGGSLRHATAADLQQVSRLMKYGFITGAPPQPYWPELEHLGSAAPRNTFELQAQGYFVGNCAHCHNPNGLAFKNEDPVNLDLRAGMIFGFNAKQRSTQISSRSLVHHQGDLELSHIYRKVSDSPEQLGLTSQMPMSTPNAPDCSALRVVGKWIRSFESESAAQAWEPQCQTKTDFPWIDLDFTVAKADSYIPKRADWSTGMPQKFKDLKFSANLDRAISKEYAVGYWNTKNICKFPEVRLNARDQRPWMLRSGQPKRPYGEIYYTTPGSYFYRNSCGKCHGAAADGNTALARGILVWSGGSVRVASFMDGMFGNNGKNLELFKDGSKNLSAQYLVWMAMEGTKVTFPAELSSYLGKNGGQMLNMMREKCINQLAPGRSSPNYQDHEIFSQVCFIDNKPASDPNLAFDPATDQPINPAAVNEWADQAAYNIGYSIFQFLNEAAQGRWKPSVDQCEKVYPNP